MLSEFKNFILRGNVLDLAVGVIIGSAFTAVVKSFTNNLISPLLGIFLGKVDFSKIVLTVGSAEFKVGMFVNDIINFIIIAFVIFIIIKAVNIIVKKQDAAVIPSKEEEYLKDIRDLLEKQAK